MSAHPVFDKHHGAWEGTYTLMDRSGRILDTHQSRLECRIEGDTWLQKNIYTWADGRSETKEFTGAFTPTGLIFDTPRLKGSAHEADARVITLRWTYTHEPGNEYAEVITLISDTHRARTWQHFEQGEFTKLTVIDERKVS